MSTCVLPSTPFDGKVTVNGPAIAGAVCTQAQIPPAYLSTIQGQDAVTNNLCGRGTNAVVTPPYAYVAGGGAAFQLTWDQGGVPVNLSQELLQVPADCTTLVGSTADCPTPAGAPGACVFSPQLLMDAAPCGANLAIDDAHSCPAYNLLCSKIEFDASFLPPCCLGELDGLTGSFSTPAIAAGGGTPLSLPLDQTVCAPGWCPYDPLGSCAPFFGGGEGGGYCGAASVSLDAGATWVSAMLQNTDSACSTWYQRAVAGQAPFSRWGYIDSAIINYCSNNPDDATSCGCFLFADDASGVNVCQRTHGGGRPCVLYTSISAPTGADNGLRFVRTVDGATGNPLNFSDYACIAPQCAAGLDTLFTSDVWSMHQSGGCPNVCLQVVSDAAVVLDGDVVPGGVYVDLTTAQCSGAMGTTTLDTPYLQPIADTFRVEWPHYNACDGSGGDGGDGCCPPGGCSVPVPIVFALASTSADMYYAISFDPPLPPGVTVQDASVLTGSLSYDDDRGWPPLVELELNVAAQATPSGFYSSNVTIADVRPQFAGAATATTQFQLNVFDTAAPAPPQGPTGPNPGVGPAIVYNDVAPPWIMYALYIILGVLALVLLRYAVLWFQSRHVGHALLTQQQQVLQQQQQAFQQQQRQAFQQAAALAQWQQQAAATAQQQRQQMMTVGMRGLQPQIR